MPQQPDKPRFSKQQYARLRAEARAPYRGLRHFVYLACAASGLIGGLIFFTRLIAGDSLTEVGANLTLQIGIVVLMIWLWRLDQPRSPD
ncbi:MAG: DUF3493 domain-containing protein [Leptolyngbyaceae cyanobacterium]